MTETIQALSLGQQLQNAREALNLSIEDVAEKTNLKKHHIEALENDIFILQNVPPAFVRGYVRNYVRFLRLPVELVGTVNYGEVTIPNEVKRTVAPIPVNDHKSQTRWLKGLTWLILLCAVEMTFAWWWQEYKKDQSSDGQLVAVAPASVPVATETENVVAQPVETPTQSFEQVKIEPVVETAKEVAVAPPVVTEPSQPVQAVNSTENMPNTPPAEPVTQPAVVENTPAVNTTESVNVLQPAVVEEIKQTEADTPPQAANNDELRIEITNAQSWITVRGAKNKKLAEKLYNSGEVLSFNGNEQYRLTIGAPANVKIYYKGQAVPLKVDGRVARFKLPLAN